MNVYFKNNPKLTEPPPLDDDNSPDRSIQDTPIWDLDELKKIALKNNGNNILIVTNKANKNYEALLESGFDLPSTVEAIDKKRDFKGAFWCKTSPKKDKHGKSRGLGSWIPCDSYSVNSVYEHPITGYKGLVIYYLKMCKGLDGNTVLFVSIHV